MNLAPVILGPAIWAETRDALRDTPRSWYHFKTYINDKFGVSEEDLNDSFHTASIKSDESVASFVRRMESLRKRLNISSVSALQVIRPKCPSPFAEALRRVSEVKIATGDKLKWEDMLNLAAKWGGLPTVSQENNHQEHKANPQQSGNTNTGGPRCTTLCARLGIGYDKHERKNCFLDPNSPLYKPEVR